MGGAGTWGRRYLRAYAEHPDCEIVALVDRARDRRQDFADRYGVKAVYDSVDQLLGVTIPEIVSIILPVGSSPAGVIACAEAGVRAISCEKPIAVSLAEADRVVDVCRQRGTALGCGTAHWEVPHLPKTADWVKDGNIGQLTSAAIPGGLPREVSGGGCVQLTMLRLLTGMEVQWVEGWTLPPNDHWTVPPGASPAELDCPAFGRLGLSGEIICEIPEPIPEIPCRVFASGENGQVWISPPRSVLIQGCGAESTPVDPPFLDEPWPNTYFEPTIERLIRAIDTGEEAQCSGHDYRQALEIAIALKLSAQRGHQRVRLPLKDRSARVYPQPYRLSGGDVAGWVHGNYTGPPDIV